MKRTNKIKTLALNFLLAGIISYLTFSCATTETKILEERDTIVKKLEERDSMRIIKPNKKPVIKKAQTTNNNN